jgi:UDP-N-acetylmuramoyl-tripeptide--D-alanyl-D-alanine ligase
MAAAIDLLASLAPRDGVGRIARGRRIAFLGEMLELGPAGPALHAAIADGRGFAAVDIVHATGRGMRALWDRLPAAQRGEWADEAADLAARAHHLVDAGDVVLVKGSKGSRVALVAEALRRLGPASDFAGGDG